MYMSSEGAKSMRSSDLKRERERDGKACGKASLFQTPVSSWPLSSTADLVRSLAAIKTSVGVYSSLFLPRRFPSLSRAVLPTASSLQALDPAQEINLGAFHALDVVVGGELLWTGPSAWILPQAKIDKVAHVCLEPVIPRQSRGWFIDNVLQEVQDAHLRCCRSPLR